jgi:hypothetical protein
MQRTDYSQIAPTYNSRYSLNYLVKLEKELCRLIELNNYKNILDSIQNERNKLIEIAKNFET